MALIANNAGVVAGHFQIPAGVPSGAKRVTFVGSGGSRAEATYIGSGEMTFETRQLRTTQVYQRYDPLAQTFTLSEACQLGGVDLWFTTKGAAPVVVQIRETMLGMPTQTVLGETRVASSAIQLGGTTRIAFPVPIALDPAVEYALVVLTDDADTALAIAELGKWDNAASRWVTAQPYQIGVLLSSSNASTWTAHQDKDLAFRLLKAAYSESTKTIALGNVAVANATDLMLLPLAEQPSTAARVDYRLTLPDGQLLNVAEGQPVRLAAPVTGNIAVSAQLTGDTKASPVLYPGAQLIAGSVSQSDDYVGRAIPAGSNVRVQVIYEALLPGAATVKPYISGVDAGDTWQAVPLKSSRAIGDGWREYVHELTGISEDMIRTKLTLTGSTAARPRVRSLRTMTL